MVPLTYLKKGYSEFLALSRELHESTGISLLGVRADMLKCALLYGARPSDYKFFSFHKLSRWERNKYMTNYRWLKLLRSIQMGGGNFANAKDKEYEIFSDCIKRDWVIIQKNDNNNKTIDEFIKAHKGCIAKPVHGTLGRGLKKIHGDEDVAWFRNQLAEDDYILEECVTNSDEIRALNPSSLNTVRAFTHITNEGKVVIDEIILRVGWPGNVVDNWGAGGIIYYVDVDSGIIVKPGIDKHMKEYIFHPGSNIQMIGYKMENFDELKAYIVSLADRLPKARVVGWDIAITPQGYDFIELNCPGGHDILQAFNVPFWTVFKHIK